MMESTVTCQFRSTAKSTSRIAKYQKSWQLADKRCGGGARKARFRGVCVLTIDYEECVSKCFGPSWDGPT